MGGRKTSAGSDLQTELDVPTSWVIDTESDSNPAVDLTNIPDPDVIEPNAIQTTPLDGLEAQQAISIANESLAKDGMRIRTTPPDELHSAQQGNAAELAREIAGLFGRRVVVFSPDGRGVPFNAFVKRRWPTFLEIRWQTQIFRMGLETATHLCSLRLQAS